MIPWRRKWKPTPVFLPGKKSPGQKVLQATVHGAPKSWTRLIDQTTSTVCMCQPQIPNLPLPFLSGSHVSFLHL